MTSGASANKPWMRFSVLELILLAEEVYVLVRGKSDCWCRSMSFTAVTSLIRRRGCRRGLVFVKQVWPVFTSLNNVYSLIENTFAEIPELENICVCAGQVKKLLRCNLIPAEIAFSCCTATKLKQQWRVSPVFEHRCLRHR